MLLTKEQILAKRLKSEKLELDDGGEIIVRALPTHVVEKQKAINAPDYGSDAYVFVNAVVNDKGERLYSDADAALVAANVDPGLIGLVVSKAFVLTQVDDQTQEKIKKNWKIIGIDLSGDSPSPSDTHTPT